MKKAIFYINVGVRCVVSIRNGSIFLTEEKDWGVKTPADVTNTHLLTYGGHATSSLKSGGKIEAGVNYSRTVLVLGF